MQSYGRVRAWQTVKPLRLGSDPQKGGLAGLESIQDAQEIAETRRKNWARTVGEGRADAAMQMSRGTLPERLAEVFLKAAGIQYRSQVNLMFAKPDFVLFGVSGGGCVVWRIQGDYWHTLPDRVVSDSQQVGHLLDESVDGQKIVSVIDVWERDIYIGDDVFERALAEGRNGNGTRFW